MKGVRESAPQLAGLEPYDPKYLPARALMSANENPCDLPADLRQRVIEELGRVAFNRYPDPLATELRALVAQENGLAPNQVLMGNGGDELLFDIALAWGGPGRTMLNLPPTFSVYAANARLTGTAVADVPRREDFTIDEDAVLARVARGDIDYLVVTSPNNPTGDLARTEFVERLLDATNALVLLDEAYCEFSGSTVLPLLEQHRNLLILRTFSKAYSLAGVRMGYVLGAPEVIRELIKVRQPYSVDAVSQAIARVVCANRQRFQPGIQRIVAERDRMQVVLASIPGIKAFPSAANYILIRLFDEEGSPSPQLASAAWEYLFARGILVRDFSSAPRLEGCLRVSMGEPAHNDEFVRLLREFMVRGQAVSNAADVEEPAAASREELEELEESEELEELGTLLPGEQERAAEERGRA